MKALQPHRADRLRAAALGSRREIGHALLRAHLNSPTASVDLPRAFKQTRALGSRDRRIAQDAIYAVARNQRRFLHALGHPKDPIPGLWLAALVHIGLPPELGSELAGVPLPGPPPQLPAPLDALAMSSSLPRWLLERSGDPASLVAGSQSRAPTCLRVNAKRGSTKDLQARLQSEGIATSLGQWSAHALVLDSPANLAGSRCFRQGWFELQDEGSQLLAALVHPTGQVIDWCAGAGGKSLAMAATMPKGTQLLAMDVRAGALQKASKRARRAGFELRTAQHSSRELPQAQRVLVDAPCSGTGTLRRDPCMRWRLSPEALDDLVQLQAEILEQAARSLAPGGRLVYATCSLLPEENQDQVQAFLARHPSWTLVPAQDLLPALCAPLCQGDMLQTRPELHGCDGFFGAVLQAPA